MKTLICLVFLCFILTLSAQQAEYFTGTNSVRPIDPRTDQMNFVPNEVLVKFKDEVTLKAGTLLNSTGISAVDKILTANGAASLKKVMDETGKTIENFGAFGGWKNKIGNFLPGKGYKVNVLENCTLILPAPVNKSAPGT